SGVEVAGVGADRGGRCFAAAHGASVKASSLPRVARVWSLGLLVFVLLAAACTATGQGQGPSGSPGQQQGSAEGRGPWEGHGPPEDHRPPEGQGPPEGRGSPESHGDNEHDFGMLPVGAHLPSGQECAARVQHDQHDQVEPRPENTAANQFVADRVSMPTWTDFTAQANQELVSRIDGHFSGTTEQILTWGACKWGLNADVLKAVAVQESDWRQSTVSDESNDPQDCVGGATPPCPTSFGIMQLKHTYLPGSYPLSAQSTAFNVDYYGARIRACYEGWITYLHNDYHPGDIWACVGWHWSGHWKD